VKVLRRPHARAGRPYRPVRAALAWVLACSGGAATAMAALDDGALAQVSGRDGLNFNLRDFSLAGPAVLTYTAPNGSTLAWSQLQLSRTDDIDQLFTDPYSLSVRNRAGAGPDVVELAFPANAAGLARWQFATDVAVSTPDGGTVNAGAWQLQDLAMRGGGLQISTPTAAADSGVAWGAALRADVGALLLRPRGRDNGTEELRWSGLHLGAVHADGSFTGGAWALADVDTQPGLFRAITDDKGPALQLQVGWSSAGAGAPLGGLVVDNIRFSSDVSGPLDLGASRIGSLQIQYMDMRLRPGH
jgi:hypothetical protein